VEGENDEQSSPDQVSAAKTKSVFIAQNVASLQELGKSLAAVRELVCLLGKCLAYASLCGGVPGF
jgi:E3 ubiquitin-protein ligase UBR4